MREHWSAQEGADIRFEWGRVGMLALAAAVRVIVIVDVLRFTTAVEAAVSRGAAVYPCHDTQESRVAIAGSRGALIADGSDDSGYSLSPASLSRLREGDAVVLPSANGSACAAAAEEAGVPVIVAACFRNATATAEWVRRQSGPYAVIACGERWPDGSLRPALEDYLAAGAVIHGLTGRRSPEAVAASDAWLASSPDLWRTLSASASGKELMLSGRAGDVQFAAELGVSATVPLLTDGAFRRAGRDLAPGAGPRQR